MEMNKKWKDFRLQESVKIFKDGAQHGFDLTDMKPGGFKKFFKSWVMQQHLKDSIKFTLKHLFEKKPF